VVAGRGAMEEGIARTEGSENGSNVRLCERQKCSLFTSRRTYSCVHEGPVELL
jgi:hypothetical protein